MIFVEVKLLVMTKYNKVKAKMVPKLPGKKRASILLVEAKTKESK